MTAPRVVCKRLFLFVRFGTIFLPAQDCQGLVKLVLGSKQIIVPLIKPLHILERLGVQSSLHAAWLRRIDEKLEKADLRCLTLAMPCLASYYLVSSRSRSGVVTNDQSYLHSSRLCSLLRTKPNDVILRSL